MKPRNLIAGVVVASALLGGCSSIVNEDMSTINFDAPECPDGTQCTVEHKKGQYSVQVPGTLTIPKSDDPLHITCRTRDGRVYVNAVDSKMGGMIWGNIIFGGGIGAIVDAHTDAHRIYPHTIKIPMCQDGRENETPDIQYPQE